MRKLFRETSFRSWISPRTLTVTACSLLIGPAMGADIVDDRPALVRGASAAPVVVNAALERPGPRPAEAR